MDEDTRGIQALARQTAMPTSSGGGSCGHASRLRVCLAAGISPECRAITCEAAHFDP